MSKRIEQRLYEAYKNGTGIKLSHDDVMDLMHQDDAVRTRISSTAAMEAGCDQDVGDYCGYGLTWSQIKNHIKDNEE